MEVQKIAVIQRLFHKRKLNPQDYTITILNELEKLGYIKTWRNEQRQIVDVGRGVNFDNAVKRYLDINLKTKL